MVFKPEATRDTSVSDLLSKIYKTNLCVQYVAGNTLLITLASSGGSNSQAAHQCRGSPLDSSGGVTPQSGVILVAAYSY